MVIFTIFLPQIRGVSIFTFLRPLNFIKFRWSNGAVSFRLFYLNLQLFTKTMVLRIQKCSIIVRIICIVTLRVTVIIHIPLSSSGVRVGQPGQGHVVVAIRITITVHTIHR